MAGKLGYLAQAYKYLYYKMYRFAENAPSRWLSEWKASLSLDLLICLLIMSGVIYYNILIDRRADTTSSNAGYIIMVILVGTCNYFIFNHRDQWKGIVKQFDQMPKKRNALGSWIAAFIVCVIFVNLIFAYYLMGFVDWSQYR